MASRFIRLSVCAALLSASLCGCGGDPTAPAPADETTKATEASHAQRSQEEAAKYKGKPGGAHAGK